MKENSNSLDDLKIKSRIMKLFSFNFLVAAYDDFNDPIEVFFSKWEE